MDLPTNGSRIMQDQWDGFSPNCRGHLAADVCEECNQTRVRVVRISVGQGWREYHTASLDCGHCVDGDGLSVGDVVECRKCDVQVSARALIAEAYTAGRLSHTRAGRGAWQTQISVYVRDESSPSGVRLLAGLDDTDDNYQFLRALSPTLSPLSPTEVR